MKKLAQLVRAGTPKGVACLAVGISKAALAEWRLEGSADLECGKPDTPCATLVSLLTFGEADGHGAYWGAVQRGVETGRQEHVAAGKLALAAINTRWHTRYHPTPSAPMTPGEQDGGGGDDGELTVKVVLETAPQGPPQPTTQDGGASGPDPTQ